ncbi:hypothetical protein Plhal304r1_c021g0075421 [Plasmopara halstedii]
MKMQIFNIFSLTDFIPSKCTLPFFDDVVVTSLCTSTHEQYRSPIYWRHSGA